MKINSKDLWKYINDELGTYDKVKLNVYYDDQYVTQIYWNGENFEWESGKFTSEAFFNPLYDFIPIDEKKIPEKLDYCEENTFSKRQNGMTSKDRRLLDSNFKEIGNKINSIIDYLKSKGE